MTCAHAANVFCIRVCVFEGQWQIKITCNYEWKSMGLETDRSVLVLQANCKSKANEEWVWASYNIEPNKDHFTVLWLMVIWLYNIVQVYRWVWHVCKCVKHDCQSSSCVISRLGITNLILWKKKHFSMCHCC